MLSTGAPPDWAQVEVAVPRPSGRLPGISMAGFHHRSPAPVDIAMVAHPSVTLLVDLSDGEGIVYDIHGRRERGSVVVGLLPGDFRATGRGVGQCLQIRFEPVAAAAVFGASIELTGTLVALEDVWGRDAEQAEDKLRAASSWDERFTIVADILGWRLRARPPVHPEVAYTWRRTLTSRGAGASRRPGGRGRLEPQTPVVPIPVPARHHPPKRAAQLVRFDHAAHLLAAGNAAARRRRRERLCRPIPPPP
ncbi:AraC family transcriptional regulator [Nonomuraea ferruginea]